MIKESKIKVVAKNNIKKQRNKIGFKDLSLPLKIVVIYGWVMLAIIIIWIVTFVVALLVGMGATAISLA